MYSSSKQIIARISKMGVANTHPTTQPPSYSFRMTPQFQVYLGLSLPSNVYVYTLELKNFC